MSKQTKALKLITSQSSLTSDEAEDILTEANLTPKELLTCSLGFPDNNNWYEFEEACVKILPELEVPISIISELNNIEGAVLWNLLNTGGWVERLGPYLSKQHHTFIWRALHERFRKEAITLRDDRVKQGLNMSTGMREPLTLMIGKITRV